MPLNIYLTGFMGSGKSRVGDALARLLGRPHLDTDDLFRQRHGISPGEFIRANGEDAFRREEQAVLKEIASGAEFAVVSTGGGLPVYPGNRRIMRESGITATLRIPVERIAARLSEEEKAARPLWNEGLYRKRLPFYNDCEIRVDASKGTPEEIAARIASKASGFLRELPTRTKVFRRLLRQCAKDSAAFSILEPGDRVLVGLSGGEDSFLMLEILASMRRKLPFRVDFVAATIDVGFKGFNASPIRKYAESRGFEYHCARIPKLAGIIRKSAEVDSPCSMCSRIRRGQLHRLLGELDCNKLALGQHLDDLCASFLMSLFHGGGLKTMGPNVPADGGKARLVRPMWGLRKPHIHEAAAFFHFPFVKSCPFSGQMDAEGDRKFLGDLLETLDRRFPGIHEAMKHSMGDIRPGHLLDKRFLPGKEDK